jgi:hypothetical protein
MAIGIDMLEKMINVCDSTFGGTWQIKYIWCHQIWLKEKGLAKKLDII